MAEVLAPHAACCHQAPCTRRCPTVPELAPVHHPTPAGGAASHAGGALPPPCGPAPIVLTTYAIGCSKIPSEPHTRNEVRPGNRMRKFAKTRMKIKQSLPHVSVHVQLDGGARPTHSPNKFSRRSDFHRRVGPVRVRKNAKLQHEGGGGTKTANFSAASGEPRPTFGPRPPGVMAPTHCSTVHNRATIAGPVSTITHVPVATLLPNFGRPQPCLLGPGLLSAVGLPRARFSVGVGVPSAIQTKHAALFDNSTLSTPVGFLNAPHPCGAGFPRTSPPVGAGN